MLKATLKASKGATTFSQTFDKSPLQRTNATDDDGETREDYYTDNDAKGFLIAWAALLDGAVAMTNNMTTYSTDSVTPD